MPPAVAATPDGADRARLHGFDVARALAMLLIVLGHALLPFMQTPIGWAVHDRSRHIAVDLWVWTCHAFLMPEFFLLAGFFARITVARAGLARFFRQRLQRVLVPLAVLLVPVSAAMSALWDWGKELTHGVRAATPAELPVLRASRLPVTLAHLWYLYYLLAISLVAAALVLMWRRLPPRWQERARAGARRSIASVWAPLGLAVPAAGMLGLAGKLQLDTPLSFALDPWIAGFHGLFFAAGWALEARADLLARFARHAPVHLFTAFISLALLIPWVNESAAAATATRPPLPALYLSALLSWLLVTGFLGLCLRATRPRPWLRFLAGSSYWCYVTHLPLVVLLQVVLWRAALPGPIKLAVILGTTLTACLVTYRYGVRDTRLGRYLG